MRLDCPNCEAVYEIPDGVIPSEGRDVQCSNCHNTWYQLAAPITPSPAAEPAVPAPVLDTPPETPLAAPPPAGVPPLKPRELSPEIAKVLREEAEREAEARKAERDTPGIQPAPNPGDATARKSEAEKIAPQETPPAKPDARTGTPTPAAGDGNGPLLPDIEKINSTLRSANQPRQAGTGQSAKAGRDGSDRSGFRRGFLMVVLPVAIAAATYAAAPQIGDAVPSVKPMLDPYVAGVDAIRGWLDIRVLAALQWFDSVATDGAAVE